MSKSRQAPGTEELAPEFLVPVTFILLVIGVPTLLLAGGSTAARSDSLTLALIGRGLIIAYSGLKISFLVRRGRPVWFATIFWCFAYVWMGLAGAAQLLAGRNPFGFAVSPDADLRSSMTVLGGLIVADLVYAKGTRSALTETPTTATTRIVTPRAVLAITFGAALVTPALLLRQGGLSSYLQSRQAVSESLSAAGLASAESLAAAGMIRAATQVPALAAMLGVILILSRWKSLRRRPVWWMAAIVALGLNVLVNNPIGNSRFWFGTVALGCLFIIPFFQKGNGYRLLVATLLVGLTVAFPYADYFRTEGGFAQRKQAVSAFMVNKLDYDASAQVSYAMQLHDVRGGDGGYQLLGAVGVAVPRSIWQEKPRPSGEILAQFNGFHFTNLSAPLWAEGYIAFGLPGVLLLLGLWGLIAGRADRRMASAFRASATDVAIVLYPPLAAYSMILIRGALQATIAQGAVLALVLAGMGWRRASAASKPAIEADSNATGGSAAKVGSKWP